MVEVFKTNVQDAVHAKLLLDQITNVFGYQANFDLADCDRVLRVISGSERIRPSQIVDLLNASGFHGEVLPDEQPVPGKLQ